MTPLDFRNKLGLTQEQMADKLGLSQSQVSRLEKGDSAPSAFAAQVYEKLSKGKVRLTDFPAMHEAA